MINERLIPTTHLKSALKICDNFKLFGNKTQGNHGRISKLQKSNLAVQKFEEVLLNSNKEKCMKLLNSFKPNEFFSSKSLNTAAVLVPLCKYNDQIALLYTVRALHLKVNGGEIAFPGGRYDNSDGILEKTALREAYEEIGIQPKQVEIWGKGPEIHRTDVKVTPVVGYIGELCLQKLKINPDEVSSAFAVPIENLSSPENFRVTRFRFGENYIIKTPVYLIKDKRIWGLTAYITHIVLSSLISDVYKSNIKFKPTVQRLLHSVNIKKKLKC